MEIMIEKTISSEPNLPPVWWFRRLVQGTYAKFFIMEGRLATRVETLDLVFTGVCGNHFPEKSTCHHVLPDRRYQDLISVKISLGVTETGRISAHQAPSWYRMLRKDVLKSLSMTA
jgi:hypothetical protein